MRLNGKMSVMVASCVAIGTIFLWVPNCVQASPSDNVTLSLQYDPPMVDVSGGNDGIVNIQGYVNSSLNGTDQVKVFLESESDFGPVVVNPSSFRFKGGDEKKGPCSFELATRVPQNYPIDGPTGISVSGYFMEGNLSYPLSTVETNVSIRPSFSIEAVTPPHQQIGAGEFVNFAVRITNTGNVEDTYEFNFNNLKDLCGMEWTIATITPKFFGVDETKTIVISAQAPQTWTTYRNRVTEFKMVLISQGSREVGGNVKEPISLFVRERGSYIPGFTPSFAILGFILVSLVFRKQKWMKGKGKSPEHPKDLYSELSMSMR
jgi:hypothetical protein